MEAVYSTFTHKHTHTDSVMQGQSAVSLWSHFKDNSLGQGWVDGRWTGMWVDMRWGRIHASLFSSLKKRKGDFLLQGVCAVLYISFSEAETVLWGLRLLGTALMWFGVPITVCMRSCVCVIYRSWMTEGFSEVIKAKTLEKSIRTTSISSISFTTKMFLRLDGKPDEFLHKGDTRVLKGVDGSRCTEWWKHRQGRRRAAGLTVVGLCGRTPVVFLWRVGEKATVLCVES